MNRKNLLLALGAALAAAPAFAAASDSFLSRMFTLPDGHGRPFDRRLTIRHHGQDAPTAVLPRHEDSFVSRMFTEPHERGRWVDRRLTLRHHEG